MIEGRDLLSVVEILEKSRPSLSLKKRKRKTRERRGQLRRNVPCSQSRFRQTHSLERDIGLLNFGTEVGGEGVLRSSPDSPKNRRDRGRGRSEEREGEEERERRRARERVG